LTSVGTIARRAALPLVLGAIGLGSAATSFNSWDEPWFLQVVARLRAGDVLYRDVSYGAGPLPVWLTEAVTYVTGLDVFAVNLVVAACFAASGVLTWAVLKRIGIGLLGRLVGVGALVWVSAPKGLTPYAPAAEVFLLATMGATLAWQRGRRYAGVLAGCTAGIAFACKQNVGILALLAFLAVVVVQPLGRARARAACLALAGFAGAAALALSPVAASGGLSHFADYGFLGKGAYVNAGVDYLDTARGAGNTIIQIRSRGAAETAFLEVPVFLPLVALLAFVALVVAARSRRATFAVPVATFGCASALTLYPRADAYHVFFAAPPLVILIVYTFHSWRPRLPARVTFAAAAIAAACVALAVVRSAAEPLRRTLSPVNNLSNVPHLRGAFTHSSWDDQVLEQARRFLKAARYVRSPIFVIEPEAGLDYLTTGLRDPTPFDYPIVTTFGRHGERGVINLLRSGSIEAVCLANAGPWPPKLAPARVDRWVRTRMVPGFYVGSCRLYLSNSRWIS
jgi:hypothetical protein